MPDNRAEVPGAAWFGALRAYLATHGVAQGRLNTLLGASVAGRSRQQIASTLTQGLRQASEEA